MPSFPWSPAQLVLGGGGALCCSLLATQVEPVRRLGPSVILPFMGGPLDHWQWQFGKESSREPTNERKSSLPEVILPASPISGALTSRLSGLQTLECLLEYAGSGR